MTRKSQQPERRMGVFKRYTDTPEQYRLDQYAARYEGQNTWAAFVDTRAEDFDSQHYRATFRKTGESWRDHMADRGRHHALAHPADVDTWCERLLVTRTHGTVYSEYLVRLEEFFSWLQFHTDHPHVVHPVLMAAATYERTRRVWDEKFSGLADETDD